MMQAGMGHEPASWSLLPTTILSVCMIGLGLLMAALPQLFPESAATIVPLLILAAGGIDIVTGFFFAPKWARLLVVWAGIAAIGTALMLLAAERPTFIFAAAVVAAWLLVKAVTLAVPLFKSSSFFDKGWLLFSVALNVLLASMAVFVAASAALPIALVGGVPDLAKYSAIPALSMLITGIAALAAGNRGRRDGSFPDLIW